jgi:ParB family chromosome partitioning protein
MTETATAIEMISLAEIEILNPRVRNKKVFGDLVASIANLGLKKPITVSRRSDGQGFDLVCGQGRLEAFIALGQAEIPAIVVERSPPNTPISTRGSWRFSHRFPRQAASNQLPDPSG